MLPVTTAVKDLMALWDSPGASENRESRETGATPVVPAFRAYRAVTVSRVWTARGARRASLATTSSLRAPSRRAPSRGKRVSPETPDAGANLAAKVCPDRKDSPASWALRETRAITETAAPRASTGWKASLEWLAAREKRVTTTSERKETTASLANSETRAHPERRETQVTLVYLSTSLPT